MRRQATTKINAEYLLALGIYGPGKPRPRGAQVEPVLPRLYANIEQTANGCWLWTGMLMKNGYGTISIAGRLELVHRVSYMVHKGDIPKDLPHVGHKCDVYYTPGDRTYRRCINPAHLEACTNLGNHNHSAYVGRAARGPRSNAVRGIDQHSAKVTEDDVRIIREDYAARRANQTELAARYGVSAMAVSKIILRKTWKHVP